MAAARTRQRTAAAPQPADAVADHPGVRAEARWVRTAPRKAQLVVREIRGRSVADAKTMLAFMTRAAARDVENVLKSAVANAETNHGLVADDLYVSAAYVGSGPTLKRWQARARGRVGRIRKRTCHITILVAPYPGQEAPAPAPEPEKPARARRARPAEPAAAPAAASEEKPKRTRKPAAAEPEAAPEQVEPEAAAEVEPELEPEAVAAPEQVEPEAVAEPVEPAAEAPKPRRPRAKKAEPAPAPEPSPEETPAEEQPKPARRRKKTDEETGGES